VEKRRRKKIIVRIQREKKRNYSFQYLITNIGREVNKLLKRLHEVDQSNNIHTTYVDRESIKTKLIEYNKVHYKKAYDSEIYNNKIYDKL